MSNYLSGSLTVFAIHNDEDKSKPIAVTIYGKDFSLEEGSGKYQEDGALWNQGDYVAVKNDVRAHLYVRESRSTSFQYTLNVTSVSKDLSITSFEDDLEIMF